MKAHNRISTKHGYGLTIHFACAVCAAIRPLRTITVSNAKVARMTIIVKSHTHCVPCHNAYPAFLRKIRSSRCTIGVLYTFFVTLSRVFYRFHALSCVFSPFLRFLSDIGRCSAQKTAARDPREKIGSATVGRISTASRSEPLPGRCCCYKINVLYTPRGILSLSNFWGLPQKHQTQRSGISAGLRAEWHAYVSQKSPKCNRLL